MKLLRLLVFFISISFLASLGFLKGGYDYVSNMSLPTNNSSRIEVFIEPGSNTRQIAIKLLNKGIIRSPFIFRVYIRFLAVDHQLRPGSYVFQEIETLKSVIFRLLNGAMPTAQVTIPEGTTIKKIATILQDAGICNITAFTEAVSDPQLIGKVFNDWDLIPMAEGLIFPDTYNFERPTSAKMVAERMLRLTKHQIDRIFPSVLPEDLTPYEGCILASIVEREAILEAERPMIASVFYNRLKKNIKLESCATILYALGEHKNRLLFEDLKINSPYNTYLHTGLPPTPISNFGTSALEAVAKPSKSKNMYFVSDGNRGHKFSKTLREHNRHRKDFFLKRKKNQNKK